LPPSGIDNVSDSHYCLECELFRTTDKCQGLIARAEGLLVVTVADAD